MSNQGPFDYDYVECARLAAVEAGVELLSAKMDGDDLVATWRTSAGNVRMFRWAGWYPESPDGMQLRVYEEMTADYNPTADVVFNMSPDDVAFVTGLIQSGRQVVFPNVIQLPPVNNQRAAFDQFSAYQNSQSIPGFGNEDGMDKPDDSALSEAAAPR